MQTKRIIILGVSILLLSVFMASPVMAGPGGKIAKAVAKSFWGKVVLVVLTIIFLPLIIYITIREKLATRRALKDLRYIARFGPDFEWFKIRQRVTDCFHRIHDAWRKEDVSEAAAWMTDWYWQNQQLVYLDRWGREGMRNVCEVKRINSIRPLLFAHRNDGAPHEGSILAVTVSAKMKDYLEKRNTGEVVEGDKKFKDVETIWSFTLGDGKWRVSNIEPSDMIMEYITQAKGFPSIEETLLTGAETDR